MNGEPPRKESWPSDLPEPTGANLSIARGMRVGARKGWYVGDVRSLVAYAERRLVTSVTNPELSISLLLSRDKMHHSVGWWRNAEYEYCWHLSISAKSREEVDQRGDDAPHVVVPHDEARFWARVIFGDHHRKLWYEPGGTDPRLTPEEARRHATMVHLRLFLEPQILDPRGEPFVPFIPQGEVYNLTRWIPDLTPEKVDR